MTFNEKQQSAFDAMMNGLPGDVFALRGFGGTGKTVTVSRVIKEYKGSVLIAAPTAAALSVIKQKLQVSRRNIFFKTLASLCQSPVTKVTLLGKDWIIAEPEDIDSLNRLTLKFGVNSHDFITVKTYRSKTSIVVDDKGLTNALQRKVKSAKVMVGTDFIFKQPDDVIDQLTSVDLFVVDEYSMVDGEMHAFIMSVLQQCGSDAPVFIACGDAGQLQPVNGEVNDLIQARPDNMKIFELTDIMRSTDNVAKLAFLVRSGAKLSGLARQSEHVIQASGDISEIYEQHKHIFDQADVALSFMNKTVDALNTYMRADRGFANVVNPGEQIVVKKNAGYSGGSIAFANGEILKVARRLDASRVGTEIVQAVDRSAKTEALDIARALTDGLFLPVEFENGSVGLIEPTLRYVSNNKMRQWIASLDMYFSDTGWTFIPADFAYSVTVHKAQGSEWDNVVYVVSKRDLFIQGGSWHPLYTAITRAKKNITVLYVD